MSEYFTNLPLINYDIDKSKPSNTAIAVDIFRRNVIRDKILSNVLSYYPYHYDQHNDRISYLDNIQSGLFHYNSIRFVWVLV